MERVLVLLNLRSRPDYGAELEAWWVPANAPNSTNSRAFKQYWLNKATDRKALADELDKISASLRSNSQALQVDVNKSGGFVGFQ